MKRIVLLVAAVSFASTGFSQLLDPVKWTWTSRKIADKTYELHMTAQLDNKWHIYAQEAGEGPEPTKFEFKPNPLVKLTGKVKEEGKMEKSFDPNFNSTLKYYADKVDFVQTVKVKSAVSTVMKGTVVYMVCDDKKCLPPKEIPFSIKLDSK